MMPLEGFSIRDGCQWAGVSRAGFYRHWDEHEPRQADTELRAAIQTISLENRFYGYRRVTAQLQRQERDVNRKRVLRLMRADNLLALRKRRYVLTTDSHHPFAIYPNYVPKLQVSGSNQLWVADITYIRLRETFLYLAVVLDAHSRKAVGWELGDTLEASLAVAALKRALADRAIAPGIVHHSDPRRAVRFARLRGAAGSPRISHQHEPHRQSLRQRQGRKLHENAEVRGGVLAPVSRRRRRAGVARRVHRRGLQPPPLAHRARLPLARPIRGGRCAANFLNEFSEAWEI